jgi:hypothetical protein
VRFVFAFAFALIPLAIVLAFAACTVSANVGELDPSASGDGGDASNNNNIIDGAGGGDDDHASTPSDGNTNADVTSPITIDAGCGVTFAQAASASFIDIQIINGAIPDPQGGTIVQGMYALTTMRVYFTGNQSGTMQIKETINIRGSSSDGTFDVLTEAQNPSGSFTAYPLHGETITFSVQGMTPEVLTAHECPTKDQNNQNRFEAQGNTLTLFDDMNQIERIYQRVP